MPGKYNCERAAAAAFIITFVFRSSLFPRTFSICWNFVFGFLRDCYRDDIACVPSCIASPPSTCRKCAQCEGQLFAFDRSMSDICRDYNETTNETSRT